MLILILDRYDRYGFDLIESVSSTISKAKEYLAENQPGPAALVLDALTVVLLPADNERYLTLNNIRIYSYSGTKVLSSLSYLQRFNNEI